MARLFITQELFDRLTVAEKMAMEGELLVIPSCGQKLRLTSAVHVLKVVSGEADPHDLVGKVKTPPELATLGGEQYLTSLVVKDVAYEVAPGFLGDPVDTGIGALVRLQEALLALADS